MANQPNSDNKSGLPNNLSESAFQQLLDIESKRIDLAKQRQQSQEKSIELNAQIAQRTIDAQVSYLKAKPKQDRYTFALVSSFILFGIIVFLSFMIWLLSNGKEEFAKWLFLALTHFATGFIGFWLRGRSKGGNNNEATQQLDLQEPDIID